MASSTTESSTLEFRVGLFMLVGLAIIGYLVVSVGRFSTGFTKYYALTVELPNASGLLRNSKVLLAGASIGTAGAPVVIPNGQGVRVPLQIDERIKISRNARIVVGSSGLMGDRFVDVMMPSVPEGGYFESGEVVKGARASGMDDLTDEGGKLVGDLRATVANLNGTITRVNTELLTPEMFKGLHDSVANLSATTKNFQSASEKLNGVLDDAKGTVAQAKGAVDGATATMASAKTAADDVQKAIGDARTAIGDVRKVLAGVRSATDDAVHGPGLLGTLISNKQLSDNLAALVANLRRSGVIFYKDRPVALPSASPAPDADQPRRKR